MTAPTKKNMSPAETSSALNATARFFSPKLMFPFIYNLDGGDGGFMRHCGELLVTKVREGQTNQWGPPKWFGCLWMREASFCFSVVFPHCISPPCPLFFCCLLCHDLYPLVFFFNMVSIYTPLLSPFFQRQNQDPCVLYPALIPRVLILSLLLFKSVDSGAIDWSWMFSPKATAPCQ